MFGTFNNKYSRQSVNQAQNHPSFKSQSAIDQKKVQSNVYKTTYQSDFTGRVNQQQQNLVGPGQLQSQQIMPQTQGLKKQTTSNVQMDKNQQSSQYYIRCGIWNIGNSCYINAVLQSLFHLPFFRQMFGKIEEELRKNKQEYKLITQLIRQIIIKTEQEIVDKDYMIVFKSDLDSLIPQFTGNSQQDAKEFLELLLNKLHEELNRSSQSSIKQLNFSKSLSLEKKAQQFWEFNQQWDNSIVVDTFTGQFINKIECQSCRNQSITFDNFMDISLSIPEYQQQSGLIKSQLGYYQKQQVPQPIDINQLLRQFTEKEIIKEYKCEKCGKQNNVKSMFIYKLPDILVIHLKRFKYKQGMDIQLKNESEISFNQNLDMHSYIDSQYLQQLYIQNATSKQPKKDISNELLKYKLKCIIQHHGVTMNNGHYTAIVKNNETNQWYLYDDENVEQLQENQIDQISKGSSEIYILFYQRIVSDNYK